MVTVGSLFAGIGGLEKGLEDTGGFKTVWQVENNESAKRDLERHWPDVRRWNDVRDFPPQPIGDWRCDLIAGGFPCQDISACNYRAEGLGGKRSGLWFEFKRIIRTLRPRLVIIENVPALTFRGLDRVLCDLAESGFDAEWNTLSARQFGGPHQRDRLFIVAYPTSERCETHGLFDRSPQKTAAEEQAARLRHWPGGIKPCGTLPDRVRWTPDSGICRMVDELPSRLDRYRCLGNAVVPAVARYIGERILEHERNQIWA